MITHFPSTSILYIGESGNGHLGRLNHPKILSSNRHLDPNYDWRFPNEGHLGRYKVNEHNQKHLFDIREKYPVLELGLRVWKTPKNCSKIYESLALNAYKLQHEGNLPPLNRKEALKNNLTFKWVPFIMK